MKRASHLSATVKVLLDADAMVGRPGYASGVRPNHRIAHREDEYFMGALYFKDRELLRPGESCEADGEFIIASEDLSLFVPGFCWDICEARKYIGTAELVEVKKTEAMDRYDV